LRLLLSDVDKQLIIKALSDYGKPMLAKKKNTREEKKEMDQIRGIISQLAFGRDDDKQQDPMDKDRLSMHNSIREKDNDNK